MHARFIKATLAALVILLPDASLALDSGFIQPTAVFTNTDFDAAIAPPALPDPCYGDVGVVSHWSKARFDDLTALDSPPR